MFLTEIKVAKPKTQSGFTIIEVVVGIGIFAILLVGVLSAYTALSKATTGAREQTVLAALSAQHLELVRNMPYSEIGTASGNPNGSLKDAATPLVSTIDGVNYSIFFEVTYTDDTADGTILAGTDVSPNDYKQVKIFIRNENTSKLTTFTTNVAPAGLEGLNNAGAILFRVFDASGQPVANANIRIESQNLNPAIILDRQTDATGVWIEVGLPIGSNEYHVEVTKTGYSTDATYPITVANPNPIKPDITVANGTVTQVSFAIDLTGSLTIRTLDDTCGPINGVNVNVRGAKLIGTTPDVLKFDQNFTSSGGQIVMNQAEWDTYVPKLLTGQPYTVYGTSPIQQITVLPSAAQTFSLILGPRSDDSLLVIVKDAATGVALEGATVTLTKGSPNTVLNATTGGSVWQQLDWSLGGGQVNFNEGGYFTDDGGVDTTGTPAGVRLLDLSGSYDHSGYLESSTFDTGGTSNFTTITWNPTSQNPATALRFQIATNTDNTTWNYVGPDGTSATYYTTPGTNIHSSHDNDQYIRYKAYLSTTDTAFTPILTSIGINYISGCFTPGQVIFPNLTPDNDYDLDVNMAGYQTQSQNNLNINGNQVVEVLMSP